MVFRDESNAPHFLANISYYRLKGYWWEMQDDTVHHHFEKGTYFEDIINLYNFDRNFRLIVFNQIPLYKMGFPKEWNKQPVWK
jgi:abortive infection bacteriophage resistance protein